MASSKARTDVEAILGDAGYTFLNVDQSVQLNRNSTIREKLLRRTKAAGEWKETIGTLNSSDVLVVQLPIRHHSLGVAKLLEGLSKRGVHIIYILHDLESVRTVKDRSFNRVSRLELSREEKILIKSASALIVHNDFMRNRIASIFGKSIITRCVSLECFDYITDGNPCAGKYRRKNDPVIIAGNLDRTKAGYTYVLPDSPQFNLYGVNWSGPEKANVNYRGSFPASEIPFVLDGSFGLVWDGPSQETCEGVYGEYLRVNNPHKTSLYLASGLPVIIWDQAAMARIIIERHVGLTVSSLGEIAQRIESLSEGEYQEMCRNATALSTELRNGAFLNKALDTALTIC